MPARLRRAGMWLTVMTLFESIFFWLAAAFYILALLAHIIYISGRLSYRYPFTLTLGGLLCQGLSIIIRWAAIGHPPVFGGFETAQADTFIALVLTLAAGRYYEGLRSLGLFSISFSLIILGQGLTLTTEHIPLTISERSLWVDLHAFLAYGGYGFLVLAAILSLFIIYTHGAGSRTILPSTDIMDEYLFRFTTIGFLFLTAAIASGCYYSFRLFGYWWAWDPVDTLAAIVWLTYATIIHLRLFYGWKEGKAARLSLIAFLFLLFLYKGLVYLPPGATYHVFEIRF